MNIQKIKNGKSLIHIPARILLQHQFIFYNKKRTFIFDDCNNVRAFECVFGTPCKNMTGEKGIIGLQDGTEKASPIYMLSWAFNSPVLSADPFTI